jgi:hypothetical protein
MEQLTPPELQLLMRVLDAYINLPDHEAIDMRPEGELLNKLDRMHQQAAPEPPASEAGRAWMDKMFGDYGYERLTPEQQQEMDTLKQQRLRGEARRTNEEILREYPVQDDTWPSRRWKADGSGYCDMSGYQSEEVGEEGSL